MSLQAWYPFNGNYENQGLGDLDLTVTTSPSYATGKVTGQALNVGVFKWTAEQSAKVLNNKALSICFWLKPTQSSGTSDLFTQATPIRKFCIFNYPTLNDLHLDWRYDDAGNYMTAHVSNGFFPTNVWTHCAITYEYPNIIKIYQNGSLHATVGTKGTMNISSFAYETIIRNISTRHINDFRVYDHCLSPKEVKEISKGLMLHYPLSSPYEIGFKNKYDNPYAEGSCLACTEVFTKSKLPDERGYNYKLKYTGTGGNYWPTIMFPNFSFTAGNRYQYSCKVRLNKYSTAIGLEFRGARCTNDWGRPSAYSFSNIPLDGKWHTLSISVVVPATFDLSGTTKTAAPLIEFYTASLSASGTVYEMDFDLKDVQVVECDGPVEFIENEFLDSTIYDTSGYKNNGIQVIKNSIKLSSDSPRGENCYIFNGTNSGIYKIPTCLNSTSTDFTISFWYKPTAVSNGAIINCRTLVGEGVSVFWVNQCLRFDTGSSALWNVSSTLSLNTWYHIVFTRNGSYKRYYVNGVLKESTATPGVLTTLGKYMSIGITSSDDVDTLATCPNPLPGNLSDFRIYSTCLSDSDIQELYNKPISIDSNGNLFAQEIIEEISSASKFEKTGIVRADNISRCLYNYFNYDNTAMQIQSVNSKVSLAKLAENNGFKLMCNSALSSEAMTRTQQLLFNGASGQFKVEFDAWATNSVTIVPDICDRDSGTYTLTSVKQHFSGVASNVNSYNTSSAYNGFFDIKCSGTVSAGTEIYITNIVISKNTLKSVGSNFIIMDDIIEN